MGRVCMGQRMYRKKIEGLNRYSNMVGGRGVS